MNRERLRNGRHYVADELPEDADEEAYDDFVWCTPAHRVPTCPLCALAADEQADLNTAEELWELEYDPDDRGSLLADKATVLEQLVADVEAENGICLEASVGTVWVLKAERELLPDWES